ncbi:hypothetical protein MMC17_007596 [Xylographa soralifera]|nr:hypothetical protein [Xylographa soralifera]
MRPSLSTARLIKLFIAFLPQSVNCIVAICLPSDNEPRASECQLAVQKILQGTPPDDVAYEENWVSIPDGMDDDPRFDDMLACGAQWIHGTCAVTMGCDALTQASMLQIHDTAARAVAVCVGPQGQTPAQSFDALAFFEDSISSSWWVTISRPSDELYYHVEVEHSLEMFQVRTRTSLTSLLVWYRLQLGDLELRDSSWFG